MQSRIVASSYGITNSANGIGSLPFNKVHPGQPKFYNINALLRSDQASRSRAKRLPLAPSEKIQQRMTTSASMKHRGRSSLANLQAPSQQTQPKKAVDMERLRRLAVPIIRPSVKTFGENAARYSNHGIRDVARYSNHGIRDSLPSARKGSISVPNPPLCLSLQLLLHKSTIKSSKEIQLEEREKQFRARPNCLGNPPIMHPMQSRQLSVPCHKPALQGGTSKREQPRKLTTDHPSHLRTNFRSRRQGEVNLQAPGQQTHPKKAADMERLQRLAVPINRATVKTFGENVAHYSNHGIRDSLPSARKGSISIPNPPLCLSRQWLSKFNTEQTSLEVC